MSKNIENTENLLNRTGFGSEDKVLTTAPVSHGVSGAKGISVTIDEINTFAHNPRTVDNPKFEEIKASIEQIGLENPLTITKRPGEPGYTLYNGGNTRLKALKELYQETGDDRFYFIDCRVMPYPGDTEVMIKHMIENETRGDMLLVDKANAVYKIKQLHEKETGETIGLRPLEKLLKTKGWKVSFVNIGIFIFTAQHLISKIPLSLSSGMGTPKVAQIRKTYNALEKYITARLPRLDAAEIQALYLDNLAHYDDEAGVGDDYALKDTCEYIGKQYDIEGPRVQFEIGYILEHNQLYPHGSTSPEFDELGRRIEQSSDATPNNDELQAKLATGTNSNHSTTGTEVNKTPTTEANSNQSTTGAESESITTVAGRNDETITPGAVSDAALQKAQRIELGQKAQGKVKFLRLQYEIVGKYLREQSEFPYFFAEDVDMMRLRVDIEDNSESWDEKTTIAVCELIPLLCGYFSASVTHGQQSEKHKSEYQADIDALAMCHAEITGLAQNTIAQIMSNHYGFAVSENYAMIQEVKQDFTDLAILLRQYAIAVVREREQDDEKS